MSTKQGTDPISQNDLKEYSLINNIIVINVDYQLILET